MPQITVPIGSEIIQTSQINKNIIRIKVPNTKFWIQGEKTGILWNVYLLDTTSNYKEILKRNITTRHFSMFSNAVLGTPFPYNGKGKASSTIIKKFIKKITKK